MRLVNEGDYGAALKQTKIAVRMLESESVREVVRDNLKCNLQLLASGMSAGTAETRSGSGLQPASPVPEGETPIPSHHPSTSRDKA